MIIECLTEPTRYGVLRAIDAGIICTRMKSGELKRDLGLGKRPIRDMEDAIKSIDNYITELQVLKEKISTIRICV